MPGGKSTWVTSPVTTACERSAQARQEHAHLRDGGVLRFVEDHEAVFERTAAHERQRRDLDHAALDQAIHALRRQHVVQRIVQRSQVRIDLLRHVAGQKAQLLARFDRGPRQDDALDALRLQRRHRHRHRQIGLARSGRADAEDDVVAADRLHVRASAPSARRDLLAAAGADDDRLQHIADLGLRMFAKHTQDRREVVVVQLFAFADQLDRFREHALGQAHACARSMQADHLAAQAGADPALALERRQAHRVRSGQCHQQLAVADLDVGRCELRHLGNRRTRHYRSPTSGR